MLDIPRQLCKTITGNRLKPHRSLAVCRSLLNKHLLALPKSSMKLGHCFAEKGPGVIEARFRVPEVLIQDRGVR